MSTQVVVDLPVENVGDVRGLAHYRQQAFADGRQRGYALVANTDDGGRRQRHHRRDNPRIEDPDTIVVSPHKVFGSQTNDLALQLRKRRINKVLLGGMLANMCVESHLRDPLEQGFDLYVVRDAVAGPRHPEWGDGYQAALVA